MYDAIYPVNRMDRQFPFYLFGVGMSDPEYDIERPEGLISYQFLLTLEGEGVMEVGGKKYALQPGSLLCMPPKLPHKYCPKDTKWKNAWIVFRGDLLSQVMSQMNLMEMRILSDVDQMAYMSRFDRLYSAAQNPLGGSRASMLLYEMIIDVYGWIMEPETGRPGKSIVEGSIDYMDENYGRDLTLEEIADYVQISRQHLCRVFKHHMGMRPMEYLAYRRVAESKKLLIGSKLSVSEIAELVGYSGGTYYGMVFKRLEGMTPGEFRRARGRKLS